ncbi:tRNA (guanosine(37)-N1)-methyltransferase TrmD, partial [Pseudoalteromonas piscicida]
APPVYTRPADFRGDKVPDILLQGDPRKVEEWRYEQSLERTKMRRPDLLKGEE